MAQEITLPSDGMMLNWLKQVGDNVSAGDIIAEVEADKATVEIEAPGAGVVLELRAEIGEELDEGAIIAVIGESGENTGGESTASAPAPKAESAAEPAEAAPAAPVTTSSNGTSSTTSDGRIKASPVARKMAEDKGIDLAQVQGTGPGGRIVKTDIENFDPGKAKPAKSVAPSVAPAGGGQTWGKVPQEDVEIIEIGRMRRAIADGTILSKSNVPHFYVTVEIDVSALLQLRQDLNTQLADEGVKISVNDMIVKATALTLKKFPNLNSHYYGDKIVRHKHINVGIAVALPNNGLINVVSHDADKVSLSAMAVHHTEMYERAREGKMKPDDIKGATFTVSNLGPYNVDSFSAIISTPESGIIAVGSARKIPVVLDDGSIGVANRMKVTISVDHRVSDGAEGAQWMQYFRELLENPMRLLV